jgi:hypothetical protein
MLFMWSLRVSILNLSVVTIMAYAAAATNPRPLLNWPLTPAAVAPAGGGFTLTIHGTAFVSGSVVRWNGSARPTKFVSNAELRAAIPNTDISHSTTSSITVFNPTPGGGSSKVVFFEVRAASSWAAFGSPVHLSAGAGPESLVTGDFNGDHKLEWLCPIRIAITPAFC